MMTAFDLPQGTASLLLLSSAWGALTRRTAPPRPVCVAAAPFERLARSYLWSRTYKSIPHQILRSSTIHLSIFSHVILR